MSNVKVWFVTGTSSGFGRAMTEHLLQSGNKVVATLRKPEAISDLVARYPATQLLVVRVDVKNKSDIIAAFSKAKEAFGRIDVVLNNAGMYIAGEIESVDDETAREVFDVNFWGAVKVTQEAVRFFREDNHPIGGKLLQISSVVGLVGHASAGYYSASKFALEGLSESLADELDPAWNIKVTIVEPGPFRTEVTQKNYHSAPQHAAYADPTSKASQTRKFYTSPETFDGDATKAAVVIDKVSQLEDPPIHFPLHRVVLPLIKDKAKSLIDVVDKYQSWSDDIYHDD